MGQFCRAQVPVSSKRQLVHGPSAQSVGCLSAVVLGNAGWKVPRSAAIEDVKCCTHDLDGGKISPV